MYINQLDIIPIYLPSSIIQHQISSRLKSIFPSSSNLLTQVSSAQLLYCSSCLPFSTSISLLPSGISSLASKIKLSRNQFRPTLKTRLSQPVTPTRALHAHLGVVRPVNTRIAEDLGTVGVIVVDVVEVVASISIIHMVPGA